MALALKAGLTQEADESLLCEDNIDASLQRMLIAFSKTEV